MFVCVVFVVCVSCIIWNLCLVQCGYMCAFLVLIDSLFHTTDDDAII